MDETDLIRKRYARRNTSVVIDRYSYLNPAVQLSTQERERALVGWLRTSWRRPVSSTSLLEIGCGSGQNLLEFLRFGFRPENMVGNDLLPERVSEARHLLPQALRILAGDARDLDFPAGAFDIVFQSTVFSSILDREFQEALAKRMWQWAAPGGGVLWYDFVYDNPKNPDVAGVSVANVKRLFPAGELRYRRVTLAPPLARLVTRIHPRFYGLFNTIPLLRTHVLCWIQKPGHAIDAAVTDSCRRLTAKDVDAMARVHEAAYGARLLTALGRYTVARYYRSHLEGPHGAGAIGIERNGDLIGFCVMVRFTDLKPFLIKNFVAVLYALLRRPSLMLRTEILRRSWGLIRSLLGLATGSREESGATRILSIAVHPAYQGMGFGKQLLHEAAEIAASSGSRKLALTVHADNTQAIKAYERDGWTIAARSGVNSFAMEKTLDHVSDSPLCVL